MTAQIPNSIQYLGREFVIVGISHEGFWTPEAEGIQPDNFRDSSCWRGYFAKFRVIDDLLELHEVGIYHDDEPPPIASRQPKRGSGVRSYLWTYRNLAKQVPYTGGLLLGDGFLPEFYVHMGFQAAWKYRHVYELLFSKGHLVRRFLRSREMAEIRKEVLARPPEPGFNLLDDEMEQRFSSAFKLKYS
ncbi:MAG: hypothetical protein ICCCNLDF_00340 [Planctomycetes bacterium]|nr:hypothetical protein [Planctomycetota bacterium]